MKQTRVLVGIVLSVVVASGCSMVKKSTGGGGGAARGPLGDTMADGVVYQRGATITAPLGCHTSGYAKLEIPPGETTQAAASAVTTLKAYIATMSRPLVDSPPKVWLGNSAAITRV
jgi:hypothetical protein